MSSFLADNLSSFCLFSYIYWLRSSFINIFFSALAPRATFPLPFDDWTSPYRMICRAFSALFRAFVDVLRATLWGCPVPLQSQPSPIKPEPRCLVNGILAQFPMGRKR